MKKAIEVSVKMRDARAATRRVLGVQYDITMRELIQAVDYIADAKGITPFEFAIDTAKETEFKGLPNISLQFISAAVEIAERSK